jgi:nucleotide-binding universal stress UspA family protein
MKRVVVGMDESPNASEVLQAAAAVATLVGANVVPARGIGWRDLCAQAKEDDADLVVVGARRTPPSGRVRRTMAARVVNRCERSVLVARRWRRPPRRLLVALDESARAAMVREFAVALARRTGGKVCLFHAVDMAPVVPADMLRQYPTAEVALRDVAGEALRRHEQLVPEELRDGTRAAKGASVWPEICEAARDYDADLVVMGSHRRKLEDRLVGTTAGVVVDHADCSVLVVRQPWPDD